MQNEFLGYYDFPERRKIDECWETKWFLLGLKSKLFSFFFFRQLHDLLYSIASAFSWLLLFGMIEVIGWWNHLLAKLLKLFFVINFRASMLWRHRLALGYCFTCWSLQLPRYSWALFLCRCCPRHAIAACRPCNVNWAMWSRGRGQLPSRPMSPTDTLQRIYEHESQLVVLRLFPYATQYWIHLGKWQKRLLLCRLGLLGVISFNYLLFPWAQQLKLSVIVIGNEYSDEIRVCEACLRLIWNLSNLFNYILF